MLLIIFIAIGVALIVAGGVIIAQSFSDYGSDFSIGKAVATGALMLGGLALIFIGFGWREIGAGQVHGAGSRHQQPSRSQQSPSCVDDPSEDSLVKPDVADGFGDKNVGRFW